jgi:DNA mismatch endonuclease (patch repair protein)
MPDNLTVDQRRRCMQAIRSRHTQPEIIARCFLHRLGFRFRLHVAQLPGRPDIVLPRFKTVIFVHGCFWHSHRCSRAVVPKTRQNYWVPKLNNTRQRDIRHKRLLKKYGWEVITVWECEVQNSRMLTKRLQSLIRSRRRISRRRPRSQRVSNRARQFRQ